MSDEREEKKPEKGKCQSLSSNRVEKSPDETHNCAYVVDLSLISNFVLFMQIIK